MKLHFKFKKPAKTYKFTWFFIALVMLSMIITVTIELIVLLVLQSAGSIKVDDIGTWGLWPFIIFAVTSVVLGFGASAIVSIIPIRPVADIIDGLNELSTGNYNARIDLGKHKSLKSVADAFNSLATELGNTEMLRSDFINNFSHEFKTPIVSISGFAKLLADDSLSDERRAEYLKIIEEEAGRLSDLATNVLNLSKVENMSILTEKKRFNASEQIRNCLLLLEKKWSAKNIDLDVEFGDYDIEADEELMKQVWINLFDNAIKFTPDGGKISVSVAGDARFICATITNYGAEIPSESLGKIFNKFYQGDTSHASRGNGIGLSIVKRIVDLHGGTVTVNSGDGKTVFAVTLPAPPEACPLPPQGKQPAATAKKTAKKGQRSPQKPPAKNENKDK